MKNYKLEHGENGTEIVEVDALPNKPPEPVTVAYSSLANIVDAIREASTSDEREGLMLKLKHK